MKFKAATIAAILAAGVTAESPEAEVKKAYFTATATPITKASYPLLIAALKGDVTNVIPEGQEAPATTKPAKEKKQAAPKTPAAPKVTETPEQALTRLKNSPDSKIAARWAKVRSVDEMGKRGPTKVTIVCEDKGPNGEELLRQIKVQDLFQVRFSAGYAKKQARKGKKASAPAATETAPAAQ